VLINVPMYQCTDVLMGTAGLLIGL